MATKYATNIVLACEHEDAPFLIKSVDEALTAKLSERIEAEKRAIGAKLFTECACKIDEWTDTYESYEPSIQEAIDYVVENVLDGGLELENTIQIASKQFNVKEEKLKEYFSEMTAAQASITTPGQTGVTVNSVKSDDHDEKRGTRDDEDTNKRVRYEALKYFQQFGDQETRRALKNLFERLDPIYQDVMLEQLLKNEETSHRMMDIAVKMAITK